MLSLPTITPRADASLWPSLRTTHPSISDEPSDQSTPHQHRRNSHSHHHHGHHSHNSSSRPLLSLIVAEENKTEQRKASIRRYGASWIRPPGVPKTYQAMMDEEHEREEQELLQRREQIMNDLQAAQTDAANAEARAQNEDEMEEERDLDEDVPEAEADESDVSASEEDSASESGAEEGDTRHTADVTFNEDSFIEGSMVEGQVSQMLAMEEASMSGALQDERDLDDDIPEAGSYEHTDSSQLDSSSEDEATQASFLPPGRNRASRRSSGAARRSPGPVLTQSNNRRSAELEGSSSIIEGSSFLRSSPAAARGSLRARFMGARGGRAC